MQMKVLLFVTLAVLAASTFTPTLRILAVEREMPGTHLLSQEAAVDSGMPKELGVFYKSGAWKVLDQAKADINLNQGFSSRLTGIGSIKSVAKYPGAEAKVQIAESQPTFYVRLLNVPLQDAVIIRLEKKKKEREVQVASFNATQQKGIKEGSVQKVSVTPLANGVASVRPQAALQPGEYILAFGNQSSAYDFGITAGK